MRICVEKVCLMGVVGDVVEPRPLFLQCRTSALRVVCLLLM